MGLIGIKDEEFMAATDATYKLSIRFDEFYKKGGGHFHYPFGNPDFNGTISFIITGDEEADSINGVDKVVNWLQENNIRIDGSIATESSSEKVIGDQIKVGRKGAVDVQIEVIGKQGHAAYPQLAQNPVHCLSKIISFFDDQVLDQGAEYF